MSIISFDGSFTPQCGIVNFITEPFEKSHLLVKFFEMVFFGYNPVIIESCLMLR